MKRKRRSAHFAELWASLSNPHFWVLVGWSLLVMSVAGFLLWIAIKTFDSAIKRTPIVCRGGGNTDWYVLLMASLAPFFGVSMLGAISELWHNLERKRKRLPRRWRDFWVFTVLVCSLGTVILIALNC